jgi:hypothetical protein
MFGVWEMDLLFAVQKTNDKIARPFSGSRFPEKDEKEDQEKEIKKNQNYSVHKVLVGGKSTFRFSLVDLTMNWMIDFVYMLLD